MMALHSENNCPVYDLGQEVGINQWNIIYKGRHDEKYNMLLWRNALFCVILIFFKNCLHQRNILLLQDLLLLVVVGVVVVIIIILRQRLTIFSRITSNQSNKMAIHITNSAILKVRCSSVGIFKKFLGSYIFMFLFIMPDTFFSIMY